MEGKMMDAISRSAVLEELYKFQLSDDCMEHEWAIQAADDVAKYTLKAIKNAPALDVAPVVHARWRYKVAYAVNARVTNIIYCTACGKGFHRVEGVNFNFCPNCGARADGEAE